MWSIILLILTIIGKVLLFLLFLIIGIFLLVLFFPVTYRIKGKKDDLICLLSVRLKWLFGLVRLYYEYPNPGELYFRIFLWNPMKRNKKKTKIAKREDKNPDTSQEDHDLLVKDEKNVTVPSETETHDFSEHTVEHADANPQENESALNKISKKIQKLKCKVVSIYVKIKQVFSNISDYIELLRDENTVQMMLHVKVRLIKILKSIRPRHIKANIEFGMSEPDQTGYLYGIYAVFSSTLGKKVIVIPNFEEKLLRGSFSISGHLTVINLLFNGLKIAFDKNLRLFIKTLKKGRNQNG